MLGNHFWFLTPDDRRRAPRCIEKFPYRPEAVGDRSPQRRTKGSTTKMISQASKVGCPIRRSMDQSSFAAPHGLSQRITSFFACACQGIHQMPLRHLIVLIANAHQYSHPSAQTPKGSTQCVADRLPFTTSPSHDAIDVFDKLA